MEKTLQESLLFRGLSESQLSLVLEALAGTEKTLVPEECFAHIGDRLQRVGVVLQGTVLGVQITPEGQYSLMQKYRPGYMLGVDIACTPTRRCAHEFYSPSGAVIYTFEFDRLDLPGCLPEQLRDIMLHNVRTFLANETVRSHYKIAILSMQGLRNRIMAFLEIRRKKAGQNVFTIPFNRQEMADYLCVNRSALSHELSLMQKEGLLRFRKNSFELFY